MKRLISNVLIFTLVLAQFSFTTSAFAEVNTDNKFKSIVIDDADLFSDNEEASINELITSFNDKFDFVVATGNGHGAETAISYFNKYIGNVSGVIFFVDMKKRIIYIYSKGSQYQYYNNNSGLIITESNANEITDNCYKYFTNKDYYNGTLEVVKQIEKVANGDYNFSSMKYINGVFLSIGLASIIMFTIVWFNRKKVSNITETPDSVQNYINNNSKFDIHFNYLNLTEKTYKSSNSGSGGGGGGGGGGGHSF